jgi:hypothetical protein
MAARPRSSSVVMWGSFRLFPNPDASAFRLIAAAYRGTAAGQGGVSGSIYLPNFAIHPSLDRYPMEIRVNAKGAQCVQDERPTLNRNCD